MKEEDISCIINGISYKPGWKISTRFQPTWAEGKLQSMGFLDIRFSAPDVYDISKTIDIVIVTPINPTYIQDSKQLLDIIMERIVTLEEHEAYELFTLWGERIYDPHKKPIIKI